MLHLQLCLRLTCFMIQVDGYRINNDITDAAGTAHMVLPDKQVRQGVPLVLT